MGKRRAPEREAIATLPYVRVMRVNRRMNAPVYNMFGGSRYDDPREYIPRHYQEAGEMSLTVHSGGHEHEYQFIIPYYDNPNKIIHELNPHEEYEIVIRRKRGKKKQKIQTL